MKLFGNTHARYEALVTEYLDGALDDAGEAKLNEHLATCAECAAEVKEQQAMLSVLRATPMAEVPRSFALPYAPPVIATSERRVSKLLRSMQVATATAALVLVALVGVNIAQGPSTIQPDTAATQELRTSNMESSDAAAKTDQGTLGIQGIAPSPDAGSSISSFAPDAQPNDTSIAASPAPVPQEQAGSRNAVEWALIVMSGFTGVLALAVVAATWLPKRPI